MAFFAASFLQAFCTALPLRPVPTTAADSAIRCRCGMAFFAVSFLQAFCAALSFRPVPTTAANSAIRCRCGIAFRLAPCHRLSHHTPYPSSTFRRCAVFPRFRLTFRRCVESPHLRERSVSVFLLPPWHSHLPKVRRFPVFSSHLPKVRGVVTASRAPCVRVSPAAVHFPPSEGVQDSPFFVPPSEGAWSRHIFESALCPCFSSRLAFPTFRRCAGFPRFRLTFRRCAVSGAADATILKRPDALCRKTSIAITRILVFLPLFNRK